MKKLTRKIAVAACFALVCATLTVHPAARAQEQSLKIIETVFEIAEKKFALKSEVDFQKMLKKGLDNLEIKIDEVLVDWSEDETSFDLVVGGEKKTFIYNPPQTWADLREIADEAFSFVHANIREKRESEDKIEYTMLNGMLSVMDRHSRVIPPQDYEEFIVETEGSFSGLGIVISTRKGWITVVSPIEDTPAHRAGIKSGDRIVRIENESTVNMSIIEAVHRLRGEKGTPVNIRILRDSMDEPKPLTIVRDTIKIESVEDHIFDKDILYIKIKNFQRNTTESILKILEKEKRDRRLTGIILDFRDNPGGLLEQAEKISDLFLKYGTVFSIKSGERIKSYFASARDRFEIREKTVVLINSGSASASEIVTGALKENDRALIMGTTTFGKGSVQDIFELEDDSALKLTIANYLIPGNISIHKVGIAPDIFIEEVDFSDDKAIYKTPEFLFQLEKQREENGPEEKTREPEPPSYTFKVLNESIITDEEEEKDPEELPQTPSKSEKRERKEKDPLVAAARRIIRGSDGTDRTDMLKTASNILAEIRTEENKHIRKKLEELNVDWSDKPRDESGGEIKLEVKITPDNDVFKAGEEANLKVRVTNRGDKPVYKLTAVVDSENGFLDGREFIFGKVAPGKKAEWSARLKIPDNAQTRNDECTLKFFDYSGKEVFSKMFTVGTENKDRPAISYNYEIVDDGRFESKGNGDGRIGKDETIALLFKIKNTGKGKSEDMGIYLKNLSGKKLFLEKAIEEVGEMNPGESRDIVMRLKVEEKWGEKEDEKAEVELIANDFKIGFSSRYRITIPAKTPVENAKREGAIQTAQSVEIVGGSFEEAQGVSFAKAGSSYSVTGSAGEWSKIKLGEDRSGWIKTDLTSPFDGQARPDFKYLLASSPVITVNPHEVVTDREEIEISGFVKDAEPIVNISFFKDNDKIHIINTESEKQNFAVNIPLEDGMNKLIITAKDSNKLRSIRTLYIRKKS